LKKVPASKILETFTNKPKALGFFSHDLATLAKIATVI
jgi:hypothetical protein